MNNLQEIWNDLDEAYEYMERAIEKMSYIPLSKELYERKERFDLSEISYMKQLMEEMMENNIMKPSFHKTVTMSVGRKFLMCYS